MRYETTSTVSNDSLTVTCDGGSQPWVRLEMETNGDANGRINIRSLHQAEMLVLMLQMAIKQQKE